MTAPTRPLWPLPESIREYLDLNGWEAVPRGALDAAEAEVERLRRVGLGLHGELASTLAADTDAMTRAADHIERLREALRVQTDALDAAEAAFARVEALCDERERSERAIFGDTGPAPQVRTRDVRAAMRGSA